MVNIFKAVILVLLLGFTLIFAQIPGDETRYVRIGDLQSNFTAYGSERAWNNEYYEGMLWPALYQYTDNFVIKRAWVGVTDFTDENGLQWDYWANYIISDYVETSLFPLELKQTAKFAQPSVFVDGDNTTAPYIGDVDEIDPNQLADRVITNVVNMTCGLTLTRRILAFSQQYHDDYFIKEFIFTNTGNVDYDEEIELSDSLRNLRIGWGSRYSVCREGTMNLPSEAFGQRFGRHSWFTKRGEEYASHVEDVKQFTEDTPKMNLDWIRCAYSWLGQCGDVDYDMIGAPEMAKNGRLTAPQFAGLAILHVDKSAKDHSDDPDQPLSLGWHGGGTYPSIGELTYNEMGNMSRVYDLISGIPYPSGSLGGTGRLFEENTDGITDKVDPFLIHGDRGGTNMMFCYGPFNLGPGESIKIVEAECVNGINRILCEEVGGKWLAAYNGSYTGDLELPPDGPYANDIPYGETTDDKDLYKNAWVFTGADSIMQTFSRALRNFQVDYDIPQPPLPPPFFEVNSGGSKIMLSWGASLSEIQPDFAGYRIYRAISRPDTVFLRIAELSPEEYYYEDKSAQRGIAYYYYITAFNDGSNNTEGITNPTGILESGKFYTITNKGAYLRKRAGRNLDDIRIVPNPYNIKSKDYQYLGEPDKIMFLDVPAYCKIRIFTERGDLVKIINHDDGSGDESWNSLSSLRQVVVSGIYIAHFEVTQDFYDSETSKLLYRKGDSTVKKFLIIR